MTVVHSIILHIVGISCIYSTRQTLIKEIEAGGTTVFVPLRSLRQGRVLSTAVGFLIFDPIKGTDWLAKLPLFSVPVLAKIGD